MNSDSVRAIIRKKVGKSSQAAFAREAKCSRAYVCDVLAGKREPGPKILAALGMTVSVSTERIYRSSVTS